MHTQTEGLILLLSLTMVLDVVLSTAGCKLRQGLAWCIGAESMSTQNAYATRPPHAAAAEATADTPRLFPLSAALSEPAPVAGLAAEGSGQQYTADIDLGDLREAAEGSPLLASQMGVEHSDPADCMELAQVTL